jgi:hypothetical protein
MILHPDDLIKIRLIFRNQEQNAFIVNHWLVAQETGTSLTAQEVADELQTAFEPLLIDLLSSEATFKAVGVQKLNAIGPPSLEYFSGASPVAGEVGGDALPPQTAGLIYRRGAVSRRAERSFVYMPFPGETDSTNLGRPSAGYVVKLDSLADEFKADSILGTAPDTITLRPVIFHRATFSWSFVETVTARTVWSQQKRRSFVRAGDALVPV